MIVSAGIVIIQNKKILLAHPTRASWTGTYSIPKGKVEEGESLIEAAIRETKEEVGLTIARESLNPAPRLIQYRNKHGKLRKKVYCFLMKEKDTSFPDVLPKDTLQPEEVDWAGFLTKTQAKKKIFWRFEPLLDLL
jgi:ADP-ribose pyrophosphatase YjhB (NUDIX family)